MITNNNLNIIQKGRFQRRFRWAAITVILCFFTLILCSMALIFGNTIYPFEVIIKTLLG